MLMKMRIPIILLRHQMYQKSARKGRKSVLGGRQVWCINSVDDNDTYFLDETVDDLGMHNDVHVVDLESEEETEQENKSNPTADIDKFWQKVPHRKGDKKEWQKCNAGLGHIYLTLSHTS
jgi:hypothetical protein